jgi:hypothetical protein
MEGDSSLGDTKVSKVFGGLLAIFQLIRNGIHIKRSGINSQLHHAHALLQ